MGMFCLRKIMRHGLNKTQFPEWWNSFTTYSGLPHALHRDCWHWPSCNRETCATSFPPSRRGWTAVGQMKITWSQVLYKSSENITLKLPPTAKRNMGIYVAPHTQKHQQNDWPFTLYSNLCEFSTISWDLVLLKPAQKDASQNIRPYQFRPKGRYAIWNQLKTRKAKQANSTLSSDTSQKQEYHDL